MDLTFTQLIKDIPSELWFLIVIVIIYIFAEPGSCIKIRNIEFRKRSLFKLQKKDSEQKKDEIISNNKFKSEDTILHTNELPRSKLPGYQQPTAKIESQQAAGNLPEEIEKGNIINIFLSDDRQRRTALTIERIEELEGEVCLLGIAATTYFYKRNKKDTEHEIADKFIDKLESKSHTLKVKVILLNPYSESAKLRAAREQKIDIDEFSDLSRDQLKDFYEDKLFTVYTDIIGSINKIKELIKSGVNIDCRLTNFDPIISTMITKEFAYIDTLSLGTLEENKKGKMGTNLPVLEFSVDSPYYKVAKSHFEYYWRYGITIDEFENFKNEFQNKFLDYSLTGYRLIKQHESWISIDPVVGCSNSCKYCVLQTSYGNNIKPSAPIHDPSEIPERLKRNKYFHLNPNKKLSLFNFSDALLPENRNILLETLQSLTKEGISSDVIISTKSLLSKDQEKDKDFIQQLVDVYQKGKIIFFLSYSGLTELDPMLEPNFKKEKFEDTLDLLTKYEFPVVHYWRPFPPKELFEKTNINMQEFITRVLKRVIDKTKCSVIVGLKSSHSLNKYYEKIDNQLGSGNSEGEIFSDDICTKIKEVHKTFTKKGEVYPIYRHASCAVSFIKRKADYNGSMFRNICRNNSICTVKQRKICFKFKKEKEKEWRQKEDLQLYQRYREEISKVSPDIQFSLNESYPCINILSPIRQEDVILITQILNCPVNAPRIKRTNQYVGSIFKNTC